MAKLDLEMVQYTSDATEILNGISVGSEISITHFSHDTTIFGFSLGDSELVLQCDLQLQADPIVDLTTLVSIYGVEVQETGSEEFADAFTLNAYGLLADGTIVILSMLPETSHHSGGCFKKISCGCERPELLAPKSCTEQLAAYNAEITNLNDDLDALLGDDDFDDEKFPTLTLEEFCGTRLAYAVEAYLAYLGPDGFNITTTEDENYLSLASFAITGLNNYYIDENQWNAMDGCMGKRFGWHFRPYSDV